MTKRNDILNEDIIELYFNQDLSCNKVAKFLDCDRNLIKNRIKQMGLKLKQKTMSEHVSNGMKVSVLLDNTLINIIDGEMLGDGHLCSPRGLQAYFKESVAFNKKEWLEYLYILFKTMTNKSIYLRKDKPNWQFATKSTIELGNIHKRWYIKNKNFNLDESRNFSNRIFIKSVPIDLILTKESLLHWYIGDGKVHKSGSGGLSTNGFTFEEVEFLRYLLQQNFGILTSHTKENTISIPKHQLAKLLEIIGKCPVECYKYKWNNVFSRICQFNSHINMKAVDQFIKTERL